MVITDPHKKQASAQTCIEDAQHLKIETGPRGSEIMDLESPAGKSWCVRVIVTITETDLE